MLSRYYRSVMRLSAKIGSKATHSNSVASSKFVPMIEVWKTLPRIDQNSMVISNDVSSEPSMSYQKGWVAIHSADAYTGTAYNAFDAVVKRRPKWVKALIGRAFTLRLLEQQEQADADFAKALSINPKKAKKTFLKYDRSLKDTARRRSDKTIPENFYDMPKGYNSSTPFKEIMNDAHSAKHDKNNSPELR